jgi:hypothetical protein
MSLFKLSISHEIKSNFFSCGMSFKFLIKYSNTNLLTAKLNFNELSKKNIIMY